MLWAIVARLMAALRCSQQVRREQRELLALNDIELRDIGLSRLDAVAAARDASPWPCWRAGPGASSR